MQRSFAALLLCSIALVAFAAAASESAAATTKTAAAQAVVAPERAMKLLAMDSAAATAALDIDSVPVAIASRRKTYTRKSKKSYGKKEYDEDDYNKESKYHSKDSYGKDSYAEKEHYGGEYKPSHAPNEHPEYQPKYGDEYHGEYDHPKYGSGEYEHHGEKDYDYEHKSHGKKYEEDSHSKKKYGYGKNKYSKEDKYEHEDKYGKDSYDSYEHKSSYGKKYGKSKYGHKEDKYAKYGGEEYYGKDSYGSYDYGYESGKKVCLKEVSRDPEHKIDLENDAETQYSWRSFFACCSEIEKKYDMTAIKDTIVPDAHLINDIMKPIEPIGYCNWTLTPNAIMEVMGSSTDKPIVGQATAMCEITAENDCIPFLRVGDIFETSSNPNLTLWVQVKAILSGKPYPFAYTHEVEEDTKAVTSSTKHGEKYENKDYGHEEVYSKNGEYAYGSEDEPAAPDHYMPESYKGIADHASVMLEGNDHIKGGSMHYTFGFTDKDGVIRCPDINETIAKPEGEIKGMLPVVSCGQYFLRLWGAPDHPYTDYSGNYHNPYESYGSYGYERPPYEYEHPPYEYTTYPPGSPPYNYPGSPPAPTYDSYYHDPRGPYAPGPYAPGPYAPGPYAPGPYGPPSPPPSYKTYAPPGYPEEYEYPTRK